MSLRLLAAGTLGVALVTAASCKQDPTTTDRVCTPGNYVFCRCKNRSEGTKLCHADGLSFDACSACDPSEELPPAPGPAEDATTPDARESKDGSGGDSGGDATGVARPTPGELLITEVMYDPSGTEPDAEWIEVYNAAPTPRLLSGLQLKDGGNRTEAIPADPPFVLAPGQYAVLARDTAAAVAALVPKGTILLEYGAGVAVSRGVLLANGVGGAVWLMDGTTTIAGSLYGGWFNQTTPGGKSVQLKTLSLDASAQQASWCLSSNPWATGSDRGTPGAASDCP